MVFDLLWGVSTVQLNISTSSLFHFLPITKKNKTHNKNRKTWSSLNSHSNSGSLSLGCWRAALVLVGSGSSVDLRWQSALFQTLSHLHRRVVLRWGLPREEGCSPFWFEALYFFSCDEEGRQYRVKVYLHIDEPKTGSLAKTQRLLNPNPLTLSNVMKLTDWLI